jgi:protein-tyrosine phosphatase
MGRIDVHSHVLPGVDDGCKTIDESCECARMLVAAGYSHCFCTPHVWPGNLMQTRDSLALWVGQFQAILTRREIPLQLLPGSELNLHSEVMDTPPHRIIPLALADKYILVDMWADKLPRWFAPAINWLQRMHLTVVLAHPERMRAVQDQPGLADQFAAMGILLQGNLQCFADHPDSDTRRTAERYIAENRYFVLGSDTHSVEGLRHRLTGLQNATALVGVEVISRLTEQNPLKFLPEG